MSDALHRTWRDIKAPLGGGDHTLLETAEEGEDAGSQAKQANAPTTSTVALQATAW